MKWRTQRPSYLYTEVSPVHVVTQEEIARFSRIAPDFEQFHQIEVLSMNITTHRDGCIHLEQVGFRLQYLRTLVYDP